MFCNMEYLDHIRLIYQIISKFLISIALNQEVIVFSNVVYANT